MRRRVALAFAMGASSMLAAGGTASPAPAQRFDLDCSGPVPRADAIWEQARAHFRIDLGAMRWCYADCKVINQIAEVQPATIWFEKSSDAEDAAGVIHFRAVNRETGEYTYAKQSRLYGSISQKAMCEKRPFSGFPVIQTKF